MIFWSSSEVYAPAYQAIDTCRRAVEVLLNGELQSSSLAQLDCKLRYVPIVMPANMAERYPPRSRLRRKERVYDCAPQLDYATFVDGTLEQQLTEYIAGIRPAAPHLAKLGATKEQILAFEAILAGAVERLLIERPDQTRH